MAIGEPRSQQLCTADRVPPARLSAALCERERKIRAVSLWHSFEAALVATSGYSATNTAVHIAKPKSCVCGNITEHEHPSVIIGGRRRRRCDGDRTVRALDKTHVPERRNVNKSAQKTVP